jgi:hypothetical protein
MMIKRLCQYQNNILLIISCATHQPKSFFIEAKPNNLSSRYFKSIVSNFEINKHTPRKYICIKKYTILKTSFHLLF